MKKVLHLNANSSGGAFVAANRLSEALNATGEIISHHLVFDGTEGNGYELWADGFLKKKLAFALHAAEKLDFLRFERDKTVRFAFSHALTGINITSHPRFKEADIIHLHWINKGFISLNGLEGILDSGKKVVWTCHDMWPFTGGCYHNRNCDNYRTGCGHCQYLKNASADDLSARLFQRKKSIFSTTNIQFVMPSKWLLEKAAESALSEGLKMAVVPNLIDTDRYVYNPEITARKAFGLSDDKFVIAFAAANLGNPFKGFNEFNLLLDKLKTGGLDAEVLLIGDNKSNVQFSKAFPVKFTGYIQNPDLMAACYHASDVYVTTSLEENLPTTIMESLACSTPVAAFAVGGIPEMIEHGKTGWLATLKDVDSMANSILAYKGLSETEKAVIKNNATLFAGQNYSSPMVARQYLKLYN